MHVHLNREWLDAEAIALVVIMLFLVIAFAY
jgi:hypothetical protein